MGYVQTANTFLKETFVCAPSFLVCAHLTTCVRHGHSLEGTLQQNLWVATPNPQNWCLLFSLSPLFVWSNALILSDLLCLAYSLWLILSHLFSLTHSLWLILSNSFSLTYSLWSVHIIIWRWIMLSTRDWRCFENSSNCWIRLKSSTSSTLGQR